MLSKKMFAIVLLSISSINSIYAQEKNDEVNKDVIVNSVQSSVVEDKNKKPGLGVEEKAYKKVDNAVNISKTRVEILKGKKSDFITIYNKSTTEEFGFTVEVAKWIQRNGRDELITDNNVLIAPKTFVVEPQKYKNIRIMAQDYDKALKDFSYRLILTQISRKKINQEAVDNNKLKVNITMTLPIFFFSEKFKEANDVNVDIHFDENKQNLFIENKDINQYFFINNININEKEFVHNWYVLPGTTVNKKVGKLQSAKLYNIEIKTDRETITKQILNK